MSIFLIMIDTDYVKINISNNTRNVGLRAQESCVRGSTSYRQSILPQCMYVCVCVPVFMAMTLK